MNEFVSRHCVSVKTWLRTPFSNGRSLILMATMLAALVVSGSLSGHAERQAVAGLQKVVLHSCQAADVKTRSDNNAHLSDYVVFSFVNKRFLVPTHTETAAQKATTAQFAASLQAAVTDASWTPVTDCKKAVEDGTSYRSPASVAFTTQSPPPQDLPPRRKP